MYYQGYRQKYIADCIGISQVQVSRVLDRIRKETQRLLKEDGIIEKSGNRIKLSYKCGFGDGPKILNLFLLQCHQSQS